MTAPAVVWRPDAELLRDEQRRAVHGGARDRDFAELVARSIDEPEWFWDAVVRFLGLRFSTPYDRGARRVATASRGRSGSRAAAATSRSRASTAGPTIPATRRRPRSSGKARKATSARSRSAELRTLTDRDRVAGSRARGVRRGDAVGLFLPMVPETVAALFAVAKLGAIFLPIFSGYGADAVAVRLEDAGAVALDHRRRLHASRQGRADEGDRRRRGRAGPDGAHRRRRAAPGSRPTCRCRPGRDVTLDELVRARRRSRSTPVDVDSEHPLFVAYTSGTTGRPKGAVHVHGGFLVKIAEEVAFQMDLRPGERLFWLTDIGWIMGPWEIVGTLANGGTLVLYDGAPDYPGPDRLWAFVERHRINVLGVSPTLDPRADGARRRPGARARPVVAARARRRPANRGTKRRGVGTSTWSAAAAARSSTSRAAPRSARASCRRTSSQPLSPCSLGGPALGMAVDVFDDDGQPGARRGRRARVHASRGRA